MMDMNVFEAAGERDWLSAVEKALRGKPFESLTAKTRDGITFQPLYAKSAESIALTARPGGKPWTVVQRVDDPDLSRANGQIIDDLKNGASGLALVFNSAPSAYGFGIADASKEAFETLLNGVHPEMISLRFEAGKKASAASEILVSAFSALGHDPATASAAFGIDPIGAAAVSGDYNALKSDVDALPGMVSRLGDAGFRGPFVTADGRIHHAAGASEAQELAATLATSVAYLRVLEAGGIAPDDAGGLMEWALAADADQFLTIAKLRAARKLWARVAEVCELHDRGLSIHAESAWRMATARDPHVNMLRATMACFAAGVGGADSIALHPFSLAIGLPDAFARRVARNTQLILLEESSLSQVADPSSGSGTMEALTEELCGKAWALFQKIEADGGMAESLKRGVWQARIASTRDSRSRDLANAKEPITGTSAFPLLDEAGVETLAAPEASATPVNPALALHPHRLAEPFEALRDAADRVTDARGKRPTVFLATLGTQADYTARATYMRNFLAAGGIDAHVAGPLENAQTAGAAFKDAGGLIACLCGTDNAYEEMGAATIAALKAAGAQKVFLAGKPGALAKTLEEAGLDGAFFMGSDLTGALKGLHADLGIA